MSPAGALRRRSAWAEWVRVTWLFAASIFAVLPFMTNRLIGGVDGRWYAFMLRGFTDQIGSGHFPHLLGEGTFAWNGGVHPFRSAPIFMLFGGLWKILTFGHAGTFATEHLTVITSAFAGTFGFYWVCCKILDGRRWLAASLAILYLFSPSWLATFYKADAYMSYMAFSAMPLVLFGNARTLLRPDGRGYAVLAAGLALIWMCHPPIALLTTTATLYVQSAVIFEQGLVSWKRALASAALFIVLSAYYFCSMSELPPRPTGEGSPASAVLLLVGVATFLAGVGRSAFSPERFRWLLLAAFGGLLMAKGGTPWLVWGAYTLGFCALSSAVIHFSRLRDVFDGGFSVVFVSAIAAAAATEATLGKNFAAINGSSLTALALNTGQLGTFLRPLPLEMNSTAVFQPGWTILCALLLGLVSLFSKGPLAPKVFGAAGATLAICFVRIPLASNFLVGYYPKALANIAGLPLPLRITPVLSSFGLMAGVLWLGSRSQRGHAEKTVTSVMVAVALLWSGYQAYFFVRIGYRLTSSAEVTSQSLRPENVMLDRYVYDLLPIPDYYSNGVMDPLLESRLLRSDGSVLAGPMEAAAAMEKHGSRKAWLVVQDVPDSASWIDIVPKITILPGEHKLLRYEFAGDRDYSGYLMFTSEHSYREYHLPDSGQPKAFGIGGKRTQVLSFWNTGQSPEIYRVLINREPGNNLDGNGGYFANLTISDLDPSNLPVQLISMDPYRVRVRAPEASTLETFRILLPGYRAYVDGQEVPISRSKDALLQVAVPKGEHDVLVRFVGTTRLWGSAIVSLLAWLACVTVGLVTWRKRAAPA